MRQKTHIKEAVSERQSRQIQSAMDHVQYTMHSYERICTYCEYQRLRNKIFLLYKAVRS